MCACHVCAHVRTDMKLNGCRCLGPKGTSKTAPKHHRTTQDRLKIAPTGRQDATKRGDSSCHPENLGWATAVTEKVVQ